MKEPAATRPVGRPSEYDPSFCEKIIALGKQGKSKVVMAAELGVSKPTIDNWARQFPDFLAALGLAMTHSQVWWENAGQKGLTAEKFNASIWSRSMAARFPEDWRENNRHELTGRDGGPIQTVDLSKMSADDLDRLESVLGPLVGAGPSGEDAPRD